MHRVGTFVHEVRVVLTDGTDASALDDAVHEALCGSVDHAPPCPWPHHTALIDAGEVTVTRTVFRCRRKDEDEVRRRIDVRLADGSIARPDGLPGTWQHMRSREDAPTPDERALVRDAPAGA